MSNIVIVESPAKAKTINKYLGEDYIVLASYGHIRDLSDDTGSVKPDEGFSMSWEISSQSKKHLTAILSAAKTADSIILATDPDREGEAIAWHVLEELKKQHALGHAEVQRVTFNAITKSAVLEAMSNPRELDTELINAYLARRALDYLVGYTLSPVLWRKVPGSKSAGRVQSVALRIICERELEIEKFNPQEYWSINVELQKQDKQTFLSRLTHLDHTKLEKFGLSNQKLADEAKAKIQAASFSVNEIIKKQKNRNPLAPFTTSTLQQEASRRLYFSAKQTMDTAQKLYQGAEIGGETIGLITYMRTDGVQIDSNIIEIIRTLLKNELGQDYVPKVPRHYSSKAKNAQEAHEAIRPSDPTLRPKDVAPYISKDELRLYELIWKRTMASQTESAILDQVTIITSSLDKDITLRASGSVIRFPGFLKIYADMDQKASSESLKTDTSEELLPVTSEGEMLNQTKISPDQHFTQPPPRYSEASLVKFMEERGIGRPSTYASIIQVIQDRSYVRMDNRRFFPEDRGRVVTAFLQSFFAKYVEYSFTADLETKLDEVSDGKLNWKDVLTEFWSSFIISINEASELRITEVIDRLNELLGPHLFPETDKEINPRACSSCEDGKLSLKFGKFGGFIGCTNYPNCRYTRKLSTNNQDPELELVDIKLLGKDPVTSLEVSLRPGPYGPYVQLGDTEALQKRLAEKEQTQEIVKPEKKRKKKAAPKPKRASLPKGMDPKNIDLAQALKLLALPREVGVHPETKETIMAGLGRFGPYLKYGDKYQSLGGDDNVLEIGLNRAVVVIAEGKNKKGARGNSSTKVLGEHPDDGKNISVKDGRFGPYVQHGTIRATLQKSQTIEAITLNEAIDLITAKAEKISSNPKKKTATKKKTAIQTINLTEKKDDSS